MNLKKVKKAVSISLGFIIAFYAQKWLELAYQQTTDFGTLIMLFLSLLILTTIIYFNLDEKGNL